MGDWRGPILGMFGEDFVLHSKSAFGICTKDFKSVKLVAMSSFRKGA